VGVGTPVENSVRFTLVYCIFTVIDDKLCGTPLQIGIGMTFLAFPVPTDGPPTEYDIGVLTSIMAGPSCYGVPLPTFYAVPYSVTCRAGDQAV